MLAERADEIIRKGLALIDIAAHCADPALLALCLWFRLDVVLIIGIGHGLLIGHHAGFRHLADEHAVRPEIHVGLHLQRHHRVDVPRQEGQPVVCAQHLHALELVHGTPCLEAEALENRERRLHGQTVYVHLSGLLDHMVRIVLLVNVDRHTVRGACQLGDRIADHAVVLLAVIGGDDIQAVPDLEQSAHVVLVRLVLRLRLVVAAEFIRHFLQSLLAVGLQGGLDRDRSVDIGQVLAALQHSLHHLQGLRRPGAVLDKGDGAVLVVPLSQVLDEAAHERENIRIVGGRRQDQLAVAESVLHGLSHVISGQVKDADLRRALLLQHGSQLVHGLLRMAVDGGVGNHDAVILWRVGRPLVIFIDVIAQVLLQHGTVGRADHLDIQRGGSLQEILNLLAVLADNADVVAARLTGPVLFHIIGAEFAETVRGKQDLVRAVIGHHDLRPVNHRGKYKGEDMLSEGQALAVADSLPLYRIRQVKELVHHNETLFIRNDSGVRINVQEILDVGGVVRLHVLDDQVIRFFSVKDIRQVVQPLVGEADIHRIHDGDLLIHDHIGVISHAVRYDVLPLEKIYVMIIDAYISDIICNCDCHDNSSVLYYLFTSLYSKTVPKSIRFTRFQTISGYLSRKGRSRFIMISVPPSFSDSRFSGMTGSCRDMRMSSQPRTSSSRKLMRMPS